MQYNPEVYGAGMLNKRHWYKQLDINKSKSTMNYFVRENCVESEESLLGLGFNDSIDYKWYTIDTEDYASF